MRIHPYNYVLEKFFRLTPDIYQFFFQPKTPQDEFTYQAGQFISILYPDGSFQPFSIANAPQQSHEIELHIRCSNKDENTKDFIELLKKQKTAQIKGPFGNCVYHNHPKPTLFLAAGTGFAQAKALIEQASITQAYPFIHLYWGVKTAQDFYLPDLINYWKRNISHFHFTPVISKADPNSLWQGKIGYVPELAIHDYRDLREFQVYVSGPKLMTTVAFQLLQEYKLPKNFFYSDML